MIDAIFSIRTDIHEKIPLTFVMEQTADVWPKGCGVTYIISTQTELMDIEQAYVLSLAGQILHRHSFQEDILVEIDKVIDDNTQAFRFIDELDIRDKRVIEVVFPDLPAMRNPRKTAVHPHSKTEWLAGRMVLFTYMRKIELSYQRVLIKSYQNGAVSYWNVSWHMLSTRLNTPCHITSKSYRLLKLLLSELFS